MYNLVMPGTTYTEYAHFSYTNNYDVVSQVQRK